MSQSITVRAMRQSDVPEALEVLNRIIAIGGTTAHETPFDAKTFAHEFLNGTHVLATFSALDPLGHVAGFQMLSHWDELASDVVDIATFARPAPDKLPGVGRALFAESRRKARTLGFDMIQAVIRGDNVQGLGYYSALGFVDVAQRRGVPLKDGTKVDRIEKRYMLT